MKIVAVSKDEFTYVKVNSFWSYICCCNCFKKKERKKEVVGINLYQFLLLSTYKDKQLIRLALEILGIDFVKIIGTDQIFTYGQVKKVDKKIFELSTVLFEEQNASYGYHLALFFGSLDLSQDEITFEEDLTIETFKKNLQKIKQLFDQLPLEKFPETKDFYYLAAKILPICWKLGIKDIYSMEAAGILGKQFTKQGFKIIFPPLKMLPPQHAYFIMRYTVEKLGQEKNWGRLFCRYIRDKYGEYAANNLLENYTLTNPQNPNDRIIDWRNVTAITLTQSLELEQVASKLSPIVIPVLPISANGSSFSSPATLNRSLLMPPPTLNLASPTVISQVDFKHALKGQETATEHSAATLNLPSPIQNNEVDFKHALKGQETTSDPTTLPGAIV